MPAYSFVEVRKWIAEVAAEHGIKLSGRRIKAVAGQWMVQSELEIDGVANDIRLHSDPTGDEATKRLLTLLYTI